MPAKVHIVIVNWNSGDWLRRCLDSVAAYGAGLVDRVVVVDNGSSDGSAALDPAAGPVEVVETGENLGFARASNLGAGGATAPLLLFLNPDAALGADTLARAVAFMESPEAAQVAICGIRLADEQGHTQRHCARFPIPRTFIGAATGLGRLFPKLFPPLLMEAFDHLESRRVDHVIGAFYLMRRELFERLGGFDERFFVYLEDLDLSLRAQQAGGQVHYLAEAVAFHKGGGTSEQVKARRLFYSLQSRILYAFKHFSRPKAWGVLAATLLIEPFIRLLRAVFRLSPREFIDTIKGYAFLVRALPRIARRHPPLASGREG